MRHFLLAKNVAYPTETELNKVAGGAVGFYYNNNGVLAVDATGANIKTAKEAMLVLGRSVEKGGPVVLPFFNKSFSYTKGEYTKATTFKATVTIPTPDVIGDYSLVVALKGMKFNERNKWTAMVYVKDNNTTADQLAKELTKAINRNSDGSKVTASVNGAVVTITAVDAGVDYEVLGADNLSGVSVTTVANGTPAYGDAKYVQDLAEKAAADAGFEYTYRDAYCYLYPDYPLNPLAQSNVDDKGYTIFTLRFAEPRKIATRDEVVNQIIQVAFPTGADAISTFETVCKELLK